MEKRETQDIESQPDDLSPVKETDAQKQDQKEEDDGTSHSTSSWSGWASGWIDTGAAGGFLDKAMSSVSAAVEVAKSKSTEAYGLVSKDLEEVSSQAKTVFGSTASNIKHSLEVFDEKTDVLTDKAVESVKKSVTSFWRYASGYAQQMFDEDDLESEPYLVQGEDGSAVPLDRLQAQLLALASDPDTFLTDPDPEDDLASDWNSWTCDLEKRQGEISDLMVSNPHIRKNYSSLVPEKVLHEVFWKRYFYKVHLIEIQERKRQLLKARAEYHTSEQKSDPFDAWDEDEDKKDIPVEEQDRLLNEYEREILTKKLERARLDERPPQSPQGDQYTMKDSDDMIVVVGKDSSPVEKDENSSDDWEKLSCGEKSPRKTSNKK